MLSTKEIKNIFEEYDIRIAEDPHDPKEILLLIGADVAGKLITGKIKSLGDLVAIETKLGWMVMGKFMRSCPEPESFTSSTLTL